MNHNNKQPVRWGLVDVFVGVVGSWVLAVVVLGVVVSVTGLDTGAETGTGAYVGRYGLSDALGISRTDPALPLWILTVSQAGLGAGFLATLLVAGKLRGNGVRHDFGLSMRLSDIPIGLAWGVFAQVVVVWAIYAPFQLLFDFDVSEAARSITDRAASASEIALLMLGVVVAAPLLEELFFRGLVLRAFERRWGPVAGVLASSALFAAVHLQALQFPALMVFGIMAAMLARRYGRLGPAVWAHVGFNLVTVVNLVWLV